MKLNRNLLIGLSSLAIVMASTSSFAALDSGSDAGIDSGIKEKSTQMSQTQTSQSTQGENAIATTGEESTQPFNDAWITGKVRGALIKEKLFGKKEFDLTTITVTTKNGVVYLTGTVGTKEQGQDAEAIAKDVTGVQSVKSSLTVVPEQNTQEATGSSKGTSSDNTSSTKSSSGMSSESTPDAAPSMDSAGKATNTPAPAMDSSSRGASD